MTKTAIIPIAGRGVRLGKLGHAIPKALLPYKGVPAIDYIFEMLRAIGINTVILVVGWKKEGIISYLEDGSSFGLDIAYTIQSKPRGIADAILRAEPYIKEDDFLVVLGDTLLFPQNSLRILDGANQIMVTKVEDPTKHGMVEVERGGVVTKIVEKPPTWDLNNWGICGAYRFNHKIFDVIAQIKPNKKTGELEISDAINVLDGVKAKVFEGTYIDMGRL